MLVNLKEILRLAEEKSVAIGAFNTPNLESIMAVIRTAEKNDVPVIIMHAELHEEIMPLDVIGPIMVSMARKSGVPVCVHLDHGKSLDYLRRSLDMGFTSIMYDGSALPYVDNVANTRKAVWMARQYSASVEAEIGVMSGHEGSSGAAMDTTASYTNPEVAEQFVNETEIDALACSFGTTHGFYNSPPKLDFKRIEVIKGLTHLPLVMHGGSGVSPGDYVEAISCGIRKINYYSYMSLAGVKGEEKLLKNDEVRYFHDLALAAMQSMAEDVDKAMRVFYRL